MSLLLLVLLGTQALEIPVENRIKPPLESIPAYDPSPLLGQINGTSDRKQAHDLFFPADSFQKVKGIADPAAYHRQLLLWFDADLARETVRLSAGAPWSVDSFKRGSCKWKEKGTEANALPYWSCFRNKVALKNAKGEKANLEVRVLINWGTQWYVTHLSDLPHKS